MYLMRKFYGTFAILLSSTLVGCGTNRISTESTERKVIDHSYVGERPAWAGDSKVRWEEQDQYIIKSGFTIMGNQRTNSCYDSAKFESKEELLSEVANEISGEINMGSEGNDEATGNYITKVLLENLKGDTRGLRMQAKFYERFRIQDTERIECFVLSSIRKSDYEALKSRALSRLAKAPVPELQKALQDRQIRLISTESQKATLIADKPQKAVTSEPIQSLPVKNEESQ